MIRAAPLCLLLLLAAAPAAGADIRIIDGATGAARAVVRGELGVMRIDAADGRATAFPALDEALSVGPSGRSLLPVDPTRSGHTRVRLRGADGRSVGVFDLGSTVLLRGEDSDDEPPAAWGSSGRIAVRTRRRIRVLGAPPITVRVGDDTPRLLAWTPDGDALAYALNTPNGDCPPPEGIGVLVPGQPPRVLLAPLNRDVDAFAWSPDGNALAAGLGPEPVLPREHRGRRGRWPATVARDYDMGTPRGDAAVRRLMLRATRALRRGAGREVALQRVRDDLNRVAERFASAEDSAVAEVLADELDRWLHAAGFRRIDALDEVSC